MRISVHIVALLLCSPIGMMGQWEVPDKMLLSGSSPGDRQMTGSATAAEADDLMSAKTTRDQSVRFAAATGVNDLDLVLVPAPSTLSTGMMVSFTVGSVNTGAVTLNVNGLGSSPLMKQGNTPLDSADLVPTGSYQAIYDGTAFQLLNSTHLICPPGFKAVTRDFCIMTTVADSVSWYNANHYCHDRGARLCTLGEWYQACQSDPSFLSTVLDYEWVDHAANNSGNAKSVGIGITSGQPDCGDGGHRTPNTILNFRCCYSR